MALTEIGSRWRADHIVRAIWRHNHTMRAFRSFTIFSEDFTHTLARVPRNAFVYLDPPYYTAGVQVYKHSFADRDHLRLADTLRRAPWGWALSYGEDPRVRELYWWAHVESFRMTTNIPGGWHRPKRVELVIRRPATEVRG